jgi:7-dehydrocholesterol reductase
MKYFLRHILGPLALILVCPPTVMLLWYTNMVLEGSLMKLLMLFQTQGFFETLHTIWAPHFWGSQTAWTILGVFALFEILLLKLLPGKEYNGPITPMGNIPTYKENGLLAFLVTIGTFFLLSVGFGLFPLSIIATNLGDLLGALNIFSLFFCLFLAVKGACFPSSSDCGRNRNLIDDYYWGTELYPRVFGIDVKLFTNCRFGMMSWGLILISYAALPSELYGLNNGILLSVVLQLIYITKFFAWEKGYMRSIDIMHDRAGFYICWGCLVWVPSVYTSATMFMVHNPVHFSYPMAALILLLGTAAILVNYWADVQRCSFREKEGKCTVWGKEPKFTVGSYKTESGQTKQSLLLASGWWGVARHFHYVPEIIGAFFWSLPALFTSPLAYFYVVFLTILLFDRAFRDEERCAKKYGQSWVEHKRKVPYKIIPYVL